MSKSNLPGKEVSVFINPGSFLVIENKVLYIFFKF